MHLVETLVRLETEAAADDLFLNLGGAAEAPTERFSVQHGRQAGLDVHDRVLAGALLGQRNGEEPVNRFLQTLQPAACRLTGRRAR